MTEITPEQLLQEAQRFRQLAAKYEELAKLLEATDLRASFSRVDALAHTAGTRQEDSSPMKRGEALRKVIVAAAKFGDNDFSAKEIADAVGSEVAEKTVFAVFQRRDDLFEEVGKDPSNKRVSRYRLQGYAWVFVYGINMDRQYLREAFARKGFHYDKFVIDAFPSALPEARLSWRNESRRWEGGTATIDSAEETELPGLAYLIKEPEGVRAFEEKEKPNYAGEIRQIVIDGRGVSAYVFNVVPKHRQKQELKPARDYLKQVISAARTEGLPEEYILRLQQCAKN